MSHLFKTPIPIKSSCVSKLSCKQTIGVKNSHRSQLPSPLPLRESMMGTHRGRSLWILTVWWWLQSLSAAERWSDLPSQWSTPPHSWESKPSGSTRLPLQWGTRNRKSSTATADYVFSACFSSISLFTEVKKQQYCIHSYKDRLLEWTSGWKCWSVIADSTVAS